MEWLFCHAWFATFEPLYNSSNFVGVPFFGFESIFRFLLCSSMDSLSMGFYKQHWIEDLVVVWTSETGILVEWFVDNADIVFTEAADVGEACKTLVSIRRMSPFEKHRDQFFWRGNCRWQWLLIKCWLFCVLYMPLALFRQDDGFKLSYGSYQLPVFHFLYVCSC